MDKELVNIVAKSLGESPSIVTSVIDEFERFIADTIRSGELKNVRVPHFGKFHVNMKKIRFLTQGKPSPKTIVVKPNSK